MTIATNDRRKEYSGNGTATVFTGPRAMSASHIKVYLVDKTTKAATLQTTGYTLTGVGKKSTTVKMDVAPASTKTLLILRTVPYEQGFDISSQGAYRPEDLEDSGLDPLSQQAQQLAEGVARAAKLRDTYTGTTPDMTLPDPSPSLLIGWNADASGLRNTDPSGPGDLLLRSDLADPTAGAELVAVKDAEGNFTAGSDVESALAQLAGRIQQSANGVQEVIRSMREGGTVKIVCLGDSITYGQLDTGGQAVTPWPSRLQSLLRQYYGNNNITVVNAGVSGNTVATMIGRFQTDVRNQNPDLILFNGGTNDSREVNGVSLDTYLANVKKVLALSNPTPIMVWGISPRFKEQRGGDGEGVVDFYRQTLKAAAVAAGAPYIDTFEALHKLYKMRAWAAGFFSSDGSHYSEEGYRYLGDFIFAKAFANDDIFMRPGQFKDARGQWIVTEAADSTWGVTDLQDADALVITASTVRAYLFVEDWEPCALAIHATVDCANSTNQAVNVNNQSLSSGGSATLNLSPNLASGATFFINDYALPSVRLRPGLNNIQLQTATSARISGFSVYRVPAVQYLPSHNAETDESRPTQFWTAARYKASTHAFELLRDGILTVSNSASGLIEPYFQIVPDIASTTRWRFRATVFPNTIFYLGQQTNDDVLYAYVYKVAFDGTNCVVSVRDHAGVLRVAATVAVAVAAGGADITVDIKSGGTGWTLFVNGTTIFTDGIPLCIGPVMVSASSTKRSYWNPPMKKGGAASDTGALVGEMWQTFTGAAPTQKLVDDTAATRTLTYT